MVRVRSRYNAKAAFVTYVENIQTYKTYIHTSLTYIHTYIPEMEGTPPEMEANSVEAPDFKEAEAETFLMRERGSRSRTREHLCASSPP